MFKFLFIGFGGFFGAILRYLISGSVYFLIGKVNFPYGTLTVNVLGCLLIGFLSGISETRQIFNPGVRLFLFVGLLGGFTTFSTFGYEVYSFMRDGQLFSSLINILLHLILSLTAVWLGIFFAKQFFSSFSII